MKSDGSIFTLENEELLITVESHGAQLSRIYDKKADREILWSADPAVWNRHSPILFPFIGKSVCAFRFLKASPDSKLFQKPL